MNRKEKKMDSSTYIKILKDTLTKKIKLLNGIISLNKEQEAILNSCTVNFENFDETLKKKDDFILLLNQLDDGFEMIFAKIRDEMKNNTTEHKTDILIIQELIKEIIEKSINIQFQEKSNKSKLEGVLIKQKQEIKNYKISNQMVSKYYKNIMNEYQGESYFLDKKK